MKLIFGLLLLSSTAGAVEQLAPNDPILMQDPTQQHSTAIADYAIESGSDKIAQRLDTNVTGLNRLLLEVADELVKHSVKELSSRGFNFEAQQVVSDYSAVRTNLSFQDVGDHAPWSIFLTNLYKTLQYTLGDKVLQATHLDDIWELNYTVPVVMHPTNHEWDMAEYQKHFTVFAGLVSYWVSFVACEAISYGAGIILVCEPIGSMIEKVMKNYIAPTISDRVYKRANGLPL